MSVVTPADATPRPEPERLIIAARLEAPGTSGIFGRVLIAPTAAIDRSRLMLVLLVDRQALPPPPSEAPADNRKRMPKSDPS